MQQRAAERNEHQRTRLAERVRKGVKSPVEERCRQPPGEHLEVGARFRFDARLDRRQREQRVGMLEEEDARNAERQRQPEALLQGAGDFIVAARALQMRDGRRDGLQEAGQREQDGDIDAATDGDGSQVLGPVMAEQRRIDDHHSHRSELRDQHRNRVHDDLPRLPGEQRTAGDEALVGKRRHRVARAQAAASCDAWGLVFNWH